MTRVLAACTLAAVLAAPLGAQAGGARAPEELPAGYQPPPGMCRVWVEGVPPSQQPAPTDCQTAVRSSSSRARVVYGATPTGSAWRSNAAPANPGNGSMAGSAHPFADVIENRNPRGELCLDTNHDGACEDSAPGVSGCLDTARAGKCDDARREVPSMIDAGAFRTGSALGAVCIDRNRDGKCDETWQAGDLCLDRDGDGRCDTPMATLIKPTAPAPVTRAAEAAPAADKARAARKAPKPE